MEEVSSTGRRSFLEAVATCGALGVAGCQGDGVGGPPGNESPAPGETPTGNQSAGPTTTGTETSEETTVSEVAVDVSDGDEVSGVVDDISSGDLLVFPSGRFRWESETHVTVDDWGIRAQDDTVFVVPTGRGDGERFEVIGTHHRERTADNFILENLTFDSPGRAAPGLHLGVRNTARVNGLHFAMNGPLSDQQQENGLSVYVENPAGTVQIENYRQFNNGDLGGYGGGDSRIGIWVGPAHEGTVYLRNPVLQGFPNNGCYVSRQPGTVIIDGGLLMNNNVSAVRVSGGVKVYGTTIYIDIDRYLDGPGRLEAPSHNTRGVWGDNRQAGTNGGLVEGVSFVLMNYRRCTGLATILENTNIKLDNCQFLLNSPIEAVQADNGVIEVADSDFTGESTESTAGVGLITGSGNSVSEHIDPGDVPVESRNSDFFWYRTHPDTPGQPTTER